MPHRSTLKSSALLALASLSLLLVGCSSTPPAPLASQTAEGIAERAGWPSLEEGEAPLPQIGIDEGVFQNVPGSDNTEMGTSLSPQALPTDGAAEPAPTYLTCRNEPSGPYLRLQTDPGRTGAINFVQGTAFLPAVKAIPTAFPYVYLGGQPQTGVAADGGVYVNYDGSWIPFVAVAGAGGTRNLPRDTTTEPGKTFVYRLDGNQSVQVRFYVQIDNELRLDITGNWVRFQLVGTALTRVGEAGFSTRTVIHPLAAGWRKSGETQVYKVMTTIAFPGKGNFSYLTQNYDFLGSSWSDLKVGQTDTPSGKDWQIPFTKARLYSACAAPRDVVTPTRTSALPNASANIRLRRLTTATIAPTTFDLSAKRHHHLREAVTLSNTGSVNSLVHYQARFSEPKRTLIGVLGSGESTSLPFSEKCEASGTRVYDLLYSRGETYTASSGPSAMPGAQPGDLLYRLQPIAVNLTCTEK